MMSMKILVIAETAASSTVYQAGSLLFLLGIEFVANILKPDDENKD